MGKGPIATVMVPAGSIDWVTVSFALEEAIDALDRTVTSVRAGRFDRDGDAALAVEFSGTVSYLCLAWNRRAMGPHERANELQENYNRGATSIPKWDNDFQLIENWDLESCPNRHMGELSGDSIAYFLTRARARLADLRDVPDVSATEVLYRTLRKSLQCALKNGCLAWHWRYVSKEDVESLTRDDLNALASSIPQWDRSFRLVQIN